MGKLLNNYFYGKAGKADYTVDDLPTTRMQLFKEMLRVRLGGLCKLNLMYMLIWLPAMIILFYTTISVTNLAVYVDDTKVGQSVITEDMSEDTAKALEGQVYLSTE